MLEFSKSKLHERLKKSAEKLGFQTLTPVQEAVIPVVASGKDIVVSSRTGSGKTGAFIFPMLEQFLENPKVSGGTRALVLVPTRELALQIKKNFEQIASFTQIKCGLVIGGEPFKYQVASIRRNPEVIIATPGRLVEHIEKNTVDFKELEFLVLDEADLMLDMGFAEELMAISDACREERQNLLFSATFNHKAFSRVRARLKNPHHIKLDEAFAENTDISHRCILADDDKHKERLVAELVKQEEPDRGFVFCRTRLQAQKVSNLLRAGKIRAEYIHGEISQSDRKQVLNRFRDGKIQVLVATDLAARGLDVEGVDLVINFTVAASGDDYVHRVGRTGRAGHAGVAVSLIDAREWNKMSSISRYLKIQPDWRAIEGLEAQYKGPKKVKSSGKAAGPKKNKNAKMARNKTRQKPKKTAAIKSSTAASRRKRFGEVDKRPD